MAGPRGSKVTKSNPSSSSVRTTRQRSRLVSADSSSGVLQNMVDEIGASMDTAASGPSCDQMVEDIDRFVPKGGEEDISYACAQSEVQDSFDATPEISDKGKGRLIEVETEFTFPIMQLPTEIRLEIYRACLTRPKKILLSKVDKPIPQTPIVGDVPEQLQDVDEQGPISSNPRARTNVILPADMTAAVAQANPQIGNPNTARQVPLNRLRNLTSMIHRSGRFSVLNRSASGSGTTTTSSNVPTLPSSNTSAGAAITPTSSVTANTWNALTPKQFPNRPAKSDDPLVVNILRVSKEIYKEARDVLYSENIFEIDLDTALKSLAVLHQRSRRHIKHIELEISTYTEILERFSEVVRLSLRYCTGLKTLIIHTPFTLPGTDGNQAVTNTTVYANGFDILRWLPQQCQVVLEGYPNPEIDAVVSKHLNLAKTQDKVTYARRQLISNESERPLGF